MPDERTPLASRWFAAACVVGFAASVAAVLFAGGIGGDLRFGPWFAAALSIAAYGAVALGGFRRAPLEDRVSWWVAVLAAHAAVGMVVAWFLKVIGALGLGAALEQAFGGFGPATLVSLIAAPLAALPFRPSAPVSRVPRVVEPWMPASAPASRPGAMLASGAPFAPWGLPTRTTGAPAPLPSSGVAETRDGSATTRGPVLRITFARIADQLPPDMLALPPARLAATLQPPGQMLVPVGLVVPRLHEGAVDVPATVLEDQLPRGAVLATSPEARARWNALRLALPMDEVRAQLQGAVAPSGTPVAVEAVVSPVPAPERGAPATVPTGSPAGDPESKPVPRNAAASPMGADARGGRRLHAAEVAAVVEHLAPAGRFETHGRDATGIGHLLLCVRHLPAETLACVARALLDALSSTPGVPVVVTLVTERATVAVAVAVGGDPVLAAGAAAPAVPMALMELLVGRAASAIGLALPATADRPRGEPRPAPGAAALDQAAPALGGLAAAADRALHNLDLGRPVAVSLRQADRRTEARWVEGRATVVAVPARRQPVAAVAVVDPAGRRAERERQAP